MSQEETEKMEVTAEGTNLRIPNKQTKEVARWINGDKVPKAKGKLSKVTEKELAVPYERIKSGSHKKGIGQGGYPVQVAEEMLKLVKNAEENARHEGLSTDRLEVSEIITNQGSRFLTPKRHRGRKVKSTHIKITLEEVVE